jgi:hypothetical protein
MNLFKTSLLVFALTLSFIVPNDSFAVDTAPVPKSILVADVNTEDARIMSQEGNTFNVAFTITNKEGIQTGVKYGLQLMPEGAKYIVDEKVYSESVTLNENSTVKKEIVYNAPSNLSGSYNLFLKISNESSFPFSIVSLGKVKLAPSVKGIQVMNDSCYLQLEGDKSNTRYTLMQNVDIDDEEVLKLTCTATNTTDKALSLTPFFETRYFSSFGGVAPQSGGVFTAIKFAKAEKKSFTVSLPKGTQPQSYHVKFLLMDENISSNSVYAGYIVRGLNGTIQKVSLDKDYYSMGDKGMVTVLWSASAGNFARSGVKYPVAPNVSFNAKITNKNGVSCASPIEQVLTRTGQDPQTSIEFKSRASCVNPKVSTTLTDDKGNILDQKEFSFTTSEGSMPKPMNTKSVLIAVMAIVVLVAIAVIIKKKGAKVQ